MKRLLVSVVDDDESVRESLPDLLRSFGFDAEPFESGDAFLASDKLHETDCVVLDVGMPGLSGPEVQKELSRRGFVAPVIFITARPDGAVRSEVLGAGAVAFLVKPFSEAAIIDAINAALGSS